MTKVNRLGLGLLEQLRVVGENAQHAGDTQTHTALHVLEMKLREARLCLLEAEKVAKGEGLELVRVLLEAC